MVNISETLGDIASVGQEGHSSSMRLHTINASLVGSLTTSEQITSVCFSTAPEGISVNVVAAGMSDGSIRYLIFILILKIILEKVKCLKIFASNSPNEFITF